MAAIDLPKENQRTVCELACRLIHVPVDSSADTLGFPDINVQPALQDAQDELQSGNAPVYAPGQGLQEGLLQLQGTGIAQNRLLQAVLQTPARLRSLAHPFLLPYRLLTKWLHGYGLDVIVADLLAGTTKGAVQQGISPINSFASLALGALLPSANASAAGAARPQVSAPPLAWHPHKACIAISVPAPASTGAAKNGNRGQQGQGSSAAVSQPQVHVYDLSDQESSLLKAASSLLSRPAPGGAIQSAISAVQAGGRSTGGATASVGDPRHVLVHDRMADGVHALAWRPCSGSMLAVGTLGGVLVWTLSGTSRPPMSMRAVGGRGIWATWLPVGSADTRVTTLSWSPDGRFLAAASPDAAGVTLLSVASGERSQVGSGLAAFTLLRWSPCGSYLFAGGVGPRFTVFETTRWTSASWDAPRSCGPVVQAAWAGSGVSAGAVYTNGSSNGPATTATGLRAPSSLPSAPEQRVVLLSFLRGGGGGHLVALHLVQEPPSLVAQLMPVLLQDVHLKSPGHAAEGAAESSSGAAAQQGEEGSAGAGSRAGGSSQAGGAPAPKDAQQQQGRGSGDTSVQKTPIASWAWDPTGERLAVLLQEPHPAAGCLALYATSIDPVVHARLLGYARLPGGVLKVQPEQPQQGKQVQEALRGQVVAHGCFSRGALFSVRGAGSTVFNLPMFFK